jgi:hypothetical protein
MYGINLIEVARVLGTVAVDNILFSKQGSIHLIYQEIIKFSAEKNIEMVRFMIKTLDRQNKDAYNDIVKILQKNFTEQDLREILPN